MLYSDQISIPVGPKIAPAMMKYFHPQTTYKSEENLRQGRPKLHADIFGIEGSFRKLDIDWCECGWVLNIVQVFVAS